MHLHDHISMLAKKNFSKSLAKEGEFVAKKMFVISSWTILDIVASSRIRQATSGSANVGLGNP